MTFLVYFPTWLLQNAAALVKEETFAAVWYIAGIRGTPVFGIRYFFASEEDRQNHLNGKVIATLLANVDPLLAKASDYAEFDVMAWKVGEKKGSEAPQL
jgi:hypothetical protein